jgi:hypothetical protein
MPPVSGRQRALRTLVSVVPSELRQLCRASSSEENDSTFRHSSPQSAIETLDEWVLHGPAWPDETAGPRAALPLFAMDARRHAASLCSFLLEPIHNHRSGMDGSASRHTHYLRKTGLPPSGWGTTAVGQFVTHRVHAPTQIRSHCHRRG